MANTKTALNERQKLFVLAYLENGGNGKQAAISAGYKERSAESMASDLLRLPKVAAELARRGGAIAKKAEISTENTLRENACIAHLDPRRLYRADGSMLPPAEWPSDIAAAIASVETKETTGEDGVSIVTHKVKFWDKGAALERLFKYQKLYADLPPAVNVTQNILNVNVERMETEDVESLYRLAAEALTPAAGGTEEDG